MKTITLYTPKNNPHNVAPMSKSALFKFVGDCGVQAHDIRISEDGDRVFIEHHQGGREDEDGIVRGGSWGHYVTGIFRYYENQSMTIIPNGYIEVDGEFALSAPAELGKESGYPVRGMQLLA